MALTLDPLNEAYYRLLQDRRRKGNSPPLEIAALDSKKTTGYLAHSTATASKELLEFLPVTLLHSLAGQAYDIHSKSCTLIRKKMFAGIGSSIERSSHIRKHRPSGITQLGAKGTDLYIEIPHPKSEKDRVTVSLAEAQILQGIRSASRSLFKKVIFEDLVSNETKGSLEAIWKLPCLFDRTRSYKEYVSQTAGLDHGCKTSQANLPTLTAEGLTSFDRMAPGGHGFFGFELLYRLLNSPQSSVDPTVSFLSNGEDLAAYPDPTIVGWILAKEIPLCMVVTEKTEGDRKGGQLCIVAEGNAPKYVTLVETAQAKASGQLDLFEELGLSIRKENQYAYFNTNLAIFNETLLIKKLKDLSTRKTKDEIVAALVPDLIENWKEQTDTDGVKRRYLQLEGAMGSVFLNLDKFYREVMGNPLVHFLLVSREDRSRFFTPIKTAFDLYLQYYSNQFSWDAERFCPQNKMRGDYPTPAGHSNDVETVLSEFKN